MGYVGSRGIHQPNRSLCQINEALLATPTNPINGLTTSTTSNVLLRVPNPGPRTDGRSVCRDQRRYKSNSLQATLRKSFPNGLTDAGRLHLYAAFALRGEQRHEQRRPE